ncbi:origin recognition complex subunit 5 [[Candida] anglica]|uniref:Origin recognition complex subunit 5 n=1 Tax=[Candida] anglica TaxID=148631 RepID=A0ABP0EC23_9ASCO
MVEVRSITPDPSEVSVLCRENELNLLKTLITGDVATSVPAMVVHGYRSVGKTHTLESFLKYSGVKTTYIQCNECVTKRVLLQRCLKRIREDTGVPKSSYNENVSYRGGEVTNFGGLCENFENLIIALEQFIDETGYLEPHVLVLDRIDQCMENADDLLPAFSRLHEQSKVTNLTVVFVMSGDDAREIATANIPHVYFKPYTQDELLDILSTKPLCRLQGNIDEPIQNEFWQQYAKIIVDLFYTYTGSNLNLLIDICHELWNHFAELVENGKYKPTEFIKIYREVRSLLLDDNVFNKSTVVDHSSQSSSSFDLPVHSQYILMACYLASLVEPKNDLHLFSKLKTLRAKARKSKKQLRKENIDSRLLTPSTFELERMLSILTVIYRNESPTLNVERMDMDEGEVWNHYLATFTLNANLDVNSQLATLASLGLVARTSPDVLSAQARWKCLMSWSTAEAVAKELNFPLRSYLDGEQ